MDRQQEILRELGLLPLWRRRDPVPDKRCDDSSAASPDQGAAISREGEIAALTWEALPQHITACRACGLCNSRQQAVPGVGQATATWLVVGEAPGAEEDRQGEPFVGQAGKLLDNMLAAIGVKRGEAVYIANVLKCRPPGNRNPAPEEVAACRPYLERQIALLRPKLILALGRFAALTLLGTDASIASLRGRVHQRQGFALVVTYHPAYLLRNLPDKAKAWEDLCLAREAYRDLSGGGGAPT